MAALTGIVVDDHPIFREALADLVVRRPDVDVVEQAGDMAELTELLEAGPPPDLLLLDVMFPGFDAASDLARLRSRLATTAVLVVSMIEDADLIDLILRAGVNGFVSKGAGSDAIEDAIDKVMNGELVEIRPAVTTSQRTGLDLENLEAELTPRQLQVLKQVAKGFSNKEIGKQMNLSPFTVRVHVSALLNVLGVRSRSAAAAIAARAGLAD